MITFDPDKIDVEFLSQDVVPSQTSLGYSVNAKWQMTVPEQGGTAYYRLPDHLMNFLEECQNRKGIIGFEWDPEDPRNFGVILRRDGDD